jgi:hypothetical protein
MNMRKVHSDISRRIHILEIVVIIQFWKAVIPFSLLSNFPIKKLTSILYIWFLLIQCLLGDKNRVKTKMNGFRRHHFNFFILLLVGWD